MVVFISTVTASAQFNFDIPQNIAKLIDNNAEIDYNLENADTTADGYASLFPFVIPYNIRLVP